MYISPNSWAIRGFNIFFPFYHYLEGQREGFSDQHGVQPAGTHWTRHNVSTWNQAILTSKLNRFEKFCTKNKFKPYINYVMWFTFIFSAKFLKQVQFLFCFTMYMTLYSLPLSGTKANKIETIFSLLSLFFNCKDKEKGFLINMVYNLQAHTEHNKMSLLEIKPFWHKNWTGLKNFAPKINLNHT